MTDEERDLVIADLEKRLEELRQLKTADLSLKERQALAWEPWKIILSTMVTAIAALGAWSAFLVFLLGHWRPG
jgi:hypothetical protein